MVASEVASDPSCYPFQVAGEKSKSMKLSSQHKNSRQMLSNA